MVAIFFNFSIVWHREDLSRPRLGRHPIKEKSTMQSVSESSTGSSGNSRIFSDRHSGPERDHLPTNHLGVSKNRGFPPKWMVKTMENPIKMGDLGVPLFLETPICQGAILYSLLVSGSIDEISTKATSIWRRCGVWPTNGNNSAGFLRFHHYIIMFVHFCRLLTYCFGRF